MNNYIYTDLSLANSLVLVIGETQYRVTQFSSTWAANEVPTATCLLAIGRDVNSPGADTPAVVNSAVVVAQMTGAKVIFTPNEQYNEIVDWPQGAQVIFDGFFCGFAYRKIMGKVHIVANLIHWCAALGFSSCLTKLAHVSNPTQLSAAAVIQSLRDAGAGQKNNISMLPIAGVLSDSDDLWVGIKNVFCALAAQKTTPMGAENSCGGDGSWSINDSALSALQRIEGPAANCPVDYTYGVPLLLDTLGISTVRDSIQTSIGQETIESWATSSFWDKLVGQYCPSYGMAFVPMVDNGIVIADTPAYNGGFWKTIDTNDYDAFNMSSELHRPLRGVGVVVGYESQTRAGVEGISDTLPLIGGCYVEDSVSPADGMLLYVAAPAWLRQLNCQPNYVGDSSGIIGNRPSPAVGAQNTGNQPSSPTPSSFGQNSTTLYQRFSQDVYVNNMMRGRAGSLSGKLRFDIAPASIIRILAQPETFIGSADQLVVTMFACVQRVTVVINAEAGLAGTTFALSHIRTETENGATRTSVPQHPLFGTSIHGAGTHGCPLVKAYDLPG